jgi:hypothetical protein
MKNNFFTKYYRVYKNDTHVSEVSVNNFKPVALRHFKRGMPVASITDEPSPAPYFQYALPTDGSMFFGYVSKVVAMEKAKAGAIAYINLMIGNVEQGIEQLRQYRSDHYQDLNVNLVDSNIRRLEQEINT